MGEKRLKSMLCRRKPGWEMFRTPCLATSAPSCTSDRPINVTHSMAFSLYKQMSPLVFAWFCLFILVCIQNLFPSFKTKNKQTKQRQISWLSNQENTDRRVFIVNNKPELETLQRGQIFQNLFSTNYFILKCFKFAQTKGWHSKLQLLNLFRAEIWSYQHFWCQILALHFLVVATPRFL